jgi:hypothetical protein
MSIIVKEVKGKRMFKKFIQFQNDLYKDNPYYVPTMMFDELNFFDKKKNASLNQCDCICFLAYKDEKIVGRICGIYNPIYNQKINEKHLRFTCFDVIDDVEVSRTLFEAIKKWGQEKYGLEKFNGPIGYTDLDRQGMLMEGFDQPGMVITNYNYPYYVKHMEELGFVKDSTIAMFIPNTYEIYWDISPEKLLHRISRENTRFWNEERTEKLKRCKLSKYQVMTLASIVYEEVKIPSEMRMIAGVYINRLRRGIALGACPTVKYAMGDFELKRILNKHLTYRSPFNTYINRGLPPAPICIPSIEAIDAVLDYSEHKYLYFCARPELDGRHNFARTLKEHNANAQKYAKAIDKLKIK